jgi:hypothetical protein
VGNKDKVKEYEYKEFVVLVEDDPKSLGVELEVLPKRQMAAEDFAEALWAIDPESFGSGAFLLKEDSSLNGVCLDLGDEFHVLNGLEIVTGVMSPGWRAAYAWDAFFQGIQEVCLDTGAPQFARGVGLHIHANGGWGSSWDKSQLELVLARTMLSLESEDVVRLFGRLSRYAKNRDVCGFSPTLLGRFRLRMSGLWFGRRPSQTRALSSLSARELRNPKMARGWLEYATRNSLVNPYARGTTEFRGFASAIRASQLRFAMRLVESLLDYAVAWLDGEEGRELPSMSGFYARYPEWATASYADA